MSPMAIELWTFLRSGSSNESGCAYWTTWRYSMSCLNLGFLGLHNACRYRAVLFSITVFSFRTVCSVLRRSFVLLMAVTVTWTRNCSCSNLELNSKLNRLEGDGNQLLYYTSFSMARCSSFVHYEQVFLGWLIFVLDWGCRKRKVVGGKETRRERRRSQRLR
ncbi:hypothetical protein GALMADRAFT_1208234 [Galerina marginata CBS 339.88]|uniref:Uncharacterized protein n=1 Tax=Galerina marginata (strain CBS 339.88) TaxID=685588 RepID=A0A067S5J6_GALM3|nr:hypothetical protein GALMADRAFT_1208234 [Galerina marginata CBS 339.88]